MTIQINKYYSFLIKEKQNRASCTNKNGVQNVNEWFQIKFAFRINNLFKTS